MSPHSALLAEPAAPAASRTSATIPGHPGNGQLPITLPPPDAPSPFHSFFMGGFECASHGRRDRHRIDVTRASNHDSHAAEDYTLLANCGIRTVRDGLRWHLIERTPGHFDWSSFLPMLRAAHATRTQVIWDLCHWGLPAGVDPFAPDFPIRFAAFAHAAATLIEHERLAANITAAPLYCAINEMSFWSWVGGDERHFFPYAARRGFELKQKLVRAALAGIRAVRTVQPTARFVQPEPAIHIAGDPRRAHNLAAATGHTAAQYQAWDMLAGLSDPARDHRPDAIDTPIGGSPDCLDIVGVNFYWNNQWRHGGERTPPGHHLHQPLHLLLQTIYQRYHRPILITETGAEASAAVGWLGYIAAELRQATRLGIPILGLCLYPVMDYPGWDDSRHCPCGLIKIDDAWQHRSIRQDLKAELAVQESLLHTASHAQVLLHEPA